ncbi:hypothetical protein [Paramicrobacterium chengjingii]|uniref:Uncharacterized protein n=1 Tax=Paramicrobacterium chengjingii TaxID=2769067 RepID=A0ABX6YM56_9MICO|nr:hypothetical protein [Microbacterium chengjingii]QPZ39407.1 hypothetical protein HCR76_04920 [Microbacterium chengjingii]
MTPLKRFVTISAMVVALIAGLLISPVNLGLWGSAPSHAADLSKFDAGDIISDQVFYDSATMTEGEIADFIKKKVPTCRSGYTCLDAYRENTTARVADSYCKALSGGSNESAARIIYKVSTACGINPQVLLVTLQKEQGLLTHEWPSTWRYTIAMGFGCPDGAPCNEKYYGFQNQLYLAARQFQIYKAWPGSFNYRAGQNNKIQWHPNASCGSSTVYIRNQATAGLYNYTPYRPNSAALTAGYGLGDSCSSYGNRNFYNYFTDWFGSTHKVGWVVKSPDRPEVYFVTGQTKHHIQTQYAYREYRRSFGGLSAVSEGYLKTLSTGAPAMAIVKDPSTGDIMLLQDSTLHRFPSCALAETWGYSCAMDIDLTQDQLRALKRGPDMSNYASVASSTTVHKLSGGKMYPYASAQDAAYYNGGAIGFVAILRDEIASKYTVVGKTLFAPATLAKTGSDKNVYFMGGKSSKWRLPSWAMARDFGISGGYTETSAMALSAYTTSGDLSMFVNCGGSLYLTNSGKLTLVKSGSSSGMRTTNLDPLTCDRLPKVGAFSQSVFVRAHGHPEVYLLEDGDLRHVVSRKALIALNGGTQPTIGLIETGSLASFATGAPILGPATLVKANGSPDVYFVDGSSERHRLPSWVLAREFGLPDGYDAVGQIALSPYKDTGKLSQFVRCESRLYLAGSGQLTRIESGDSAGFDVTELQASTCAALDKGGTISGRVFVRVAGAPEVYLLEAGHVRHVVSTSALLALNGGKMPTLVNVSSATLNSYELGFPVLGPGTLVKETSKSEVFLIIGDQKIRVPTWGVAIDLGLGTTYTSVPDESTQGYERSSTDLSPMVMCSGELYIGAGGTFSSINSSHGMKYTQLDPGMCGSLDYSGPTIANRLIVEDGASGDLYLVENGEFNLVKDNEKVKDMKGHDDLVILTLDSRTISAYAG